MNSLTKGLTILDTTLREGEQFSGSYFRPEQRLAIARQLDAIGVGMIEVPSPIASPDTRSAVAQISRNRARCPVAAGTRSRRP